MVKSTPFHPRLAELNTTQLWQHWAGYLVGHAVRHRRQARVLRRSQCRRLLRRLPAVQVRDLRAGRRTVPRRGAARATSAPAAQVARSTRSGATTRGYVLEDGVVFRHSANDFLLTAAEPNLSFLQNQIGSLEVSVDDVSDDTRCSLFRARARAR